MISILKRIRTGLFGNASRKQVMLRAAVDLCVANIVLIIAAVLRIVVTGHLNFDNPVGQMISKVNAEYFLHASWFGVWAVGLLALAGIYRPVPSSQIGRRFLTVTGACAVGFVLHIGVTLLVLPERLSAAVAVATPEWTLLAITVFGIRYSRMSMGQHYRVVPRQKDEHGKVEDVLIIGGAGYIGSVLTDQLLAKGYRVRILDMELFGRESLQTMIKHPRLEFMNGDFRNIEDLVKALHDIDAVIHLAAIVGDPACALDNDTTIAVAGQSGNFEINVMMPICAFNLLQSIELLSTSSLNLSSQCISGLKATNAGPDMVERGLAIVTTLVPYIGYDQAASIAKEAQETGKTIKDISLIRTDIPSDELDKILDAFSMTEPGNGDGISVG